MASERHLSKRCVTRRQQRFDVANAQQTAATGCIFLRFVCPALATPAMRGMLRRRASPRLARALLMCGKLLQSLANGAVSQKEPHLMATTSAFIAQETPALLAFYERFVDVDDSIQFDRYRYCSLSSFVCVF
jgi:hypothetical protein